MPKPTLIAALVASFVSAPALPQIGSLVADFNPTTITPQADNTALASMTDSVNGIVAAQATGANQPKYRTAGFNGKPCIEFAGTNWLGIASPGAIKTALDSKTYTIVAILDATVATSFGCFFGATAAGVTDGQNHIANATRIGRYQGNFTTRAAPFAASGWTVYGNTSNAAWTGQVAALECMYLQGGCFASVAGAVPATGSTDTTHALGARHSTGVLPWKGRMHRFLVWNRALTPVEMYQVQAWACSVYNQATPWASVNKTLTIAGNSLSASVGVTDMVDGYPYKLATALGLAYGQWSMCAVGGVQMNTMLTKTTDYLGIPAVTGKGHVIPVFEWANDKNGFSAAVCWDHQVAYAALVNAAPNTDLIMGSSLGYSGDPSVPRNDFDALCDANAAPLCEIYVPLHQNTLIGTPTAYAAGSATYWNADGLHFIAAGQTVLKDIFQTPVATRLAA